MLDPKYFDYNNLPAWEGYRPVKTKSKIKIEARKRRKRVLNRRYNRAGPNGKVRPKIAYVNVKGSRKRKLAAIKQMRTIREKKRLKLEQLKLEQEKLNATVNECS